MKIVNTYIYRALVGYIMIDTGYEHSLKKIEKSAIKQGEKLFEIKFVKIICSKYKNAN